MPIGINTAVIHKMESRTVFGIASMAAKATSGVYKRNAKSGTITDRLVTRLTRSSEKLRWIGAEKIDVRR